MTIEKGDVMKYFRITDDCGWTHTIKTIHDETTPDLVVLLTPYTRWAEEITREEYEKERSDNNATD